MASISNELILYNNVQEGKIKLDRLNDEGLKAYRRGEAEFKASSSPMSKKKKEKKISAVPAEGDMFAPLPSGAFSQPLPSRSTTPALPKVDMQKAFQEASRVVPPTPVSEGATPFEKQKFNEQSAKYLGKQLQDQPIYTGTPPVQAKAGTIVKGTPENVKARQQVLKQKQEFENTAKEFEKQVIKNNKTIPQRIKETLSDAKELAKTNPSLAYEQLARGVVNAASLGLIDRLVMEERAKELDKLTGKQGQAVRNIGEILGVVAPYGAAVSATGKLGKVIAPLTPKAAQVIGKSPIRYEAAREAAASGALNLATQAAEAPFVDRTPSERLGSFATDVGLGGAFGAVGGAITKGIGKLSSLKVAEVPSAPKVEEPPIVEQAPVTPKSKPEQKQNILDQIEEILKVQNKDRLDKIIPDESSWKKATRQQKLEHNQNANLPNDIKSTSKTWRNIAKTIEENNLDMKLTEDLVRKVGTDSKLQLKIMMEVEKEIAKAKGISKPTAPIRTYEEVTVNDVTKKITKEINDLQIKFDNEIADAKKSGAKTAPITRKYNKQIKELDAQRKAEQDRLWKGYTSNTQPEAPVAAPKPKVTKPKKSKLNDGAVAPSSKEVSESQKILSKIEEDLTKTVSEKQTVPKTKSRRQLKEEADLKTKQEQQAKQEAEQKAITDKHSRIIRQLPDKDLQKLASTNKEDQRFVNEVIRRKQEGVSVSTSASKQSKLGDEVAKFFGVQKSIEDKVDSPEFKKMFQENRYPEQLFDDFKNLFRDLDALEKEYLDVELLDTPNKSRVTDYENKQQSLWDEFNRKENQILVNKGLKPTDASVGAKSEVKKTKDVTLDDVEDVMNKRNDAVADAEKAKLGIVPSASAVTGGRFDISKTALQASDPLVEQALTSTRSRTNRLVQRAKEMFNLAVEGMSKFKPFVALANPVREILYTGDRQLQKVPDLVERQLRTVFKPLTGTDAQKAKKMDLIARTILARDLDETVKADPSADLPFEANPAEIAKQRAEYERLIQAYPDVRAVLDNYEDLMKAQFNTMVELGVIKPNKARVNYYPHRVLEYTSELTYGGGKKLDTPYRWNTMKRKGYKGAIDAAVVDVLRDVLIKSHSDNIIQKTLNATLNKVDVLSKVKFADVAKQVSPEAAQLLKPYGQQYGIFSNQMRTVLSSLGVPEDELDLIVDNLWKDSKQHPKIQAALIDEKGFKYNGEDYVFFNPRYTSDVYLIPKVAAEHMAEFGKPLGEGAVWRAVSGATGFFKRWALTITAPARIPYDAFSNVGKLLRHDPRALTYIPTAIRISLQRLDSAKARKLSAFIAKIIDKEKIKEKIKLDSETRRLAISEGVVEPGNITRGVYSFTPTWEKILRRGLNLTGISGNTTQAVDEFFRLVKLSADVDRIKKGKMVKSAGIIDVEDLTPVKQASKVAQEFFVDPRRQSRLMRKWFTMGGFMPFLNWFAVDILHTMRALKNNPKKELAYLAVLVAFYESWNNTGERKEIEQKLTPEKRQIPHLITGYTDEKGKPYIIYFGGLAGSTLYQSTGATFIPQAISDVTTGQKTAEEVLSQTADKARQAVTKTPTNLLSPIAKLPAELALNKSFFTEKPIYQQQGSFGKRFEQQAGYAATQLIPQIRSFQSASKALAEEKTGEETVADSILNSLQKTFDPTKRFIKAEDLDQMGQLMDYEKLRKQYGVTAEIKEKMIPAIAKYLETDDATEVRQLMAESGLSKQALGAFIRSSQKDVLIERIKNSNDPALIKELRAKIDEIKKIDRKKLKRRLGE